MTANTMAAGALMVRAVVANEVRVRLRRMSSLVALLAVIAVAWMVIPDPAAGRTLIVIDKARVLYTSEALAIGSSGLASLLFGLGAFYLVRGRTREDLLHGLGGVLGASPVGNAGLLFARWLGAVAYLAALVAGLMATMMVLQLVRGDAPVEPLVFLRTYALLLMPTLLLAASVAVLCDAFAPLMGKGGDVLYFAFWLGSFSAVPEQITRQGSQMGPLASIDVTGLAAVFFRFRALFHTEHFSIGGNFYNAALAPIRLDDFWTAEMVTMRLVCMLVVTLPLLLAIVVFHRYSPDRVKAAAAQRRLSPLAVLNRLLSPAARLVRPLLIFAARVPSFWGQALADAALTLIANPGAVVAMIAIVLAGMFAQPASLGGVLVAAMACWGILISDLSVRDYQSATETMTGAVPGGSSRRYLRQLMVTAALGWLCAGGVLVRWSVSQPLRAVALVTGIFALSSAASLFGRLTRTGRTFLALFLFGLYVATKVKTVPWLDMVGFNGAATVQSISWQLAAGLIACAAGVIHNRRQGV